MKLLIAGSRSITAFDLSPYIPADVDTVISGGALHKHLFYFSTIVTLESINR